MTTLEQEKTYWEIDGEVVTRIDVFTCNPGGKPRWAAQAHIFMEKTRHGHVLATAGTAVCAGGNPCLGRLFYGDDEGEIISKAVTKARDLDLKKSDAK